MEVIAAVDIHQSSWMDKQTGKKSSSVDFVVTDIALSLKHATITGIETSSGNGYGGSDRGIRQQEDRRMHGSGGDYPSADSACRSEIQAPASPSDDPWRDVPPGSFEGVDGKLEF